MSKNEEDTHKDDDNMDLSDIQSADKVVAVSIFYQNSILSVTTINRITFPSQYTHDFVIRITFILI